MALKTRMEIGLDGVPKWTVERQSRTASGTASRIPGHVTEPNTGLEHSLETISGSKAILWTGPDGKQRSISPDEAKRISEGLSRKRITGEGESIG